MGTIEPWRTPFGSAQHAQANHPPPGHGKSIIKGLFSATVPIRLVLNQTHVDPSPVPHGFARLGLALYSIYLDRFQVPRRFRLPIKHNLRAPFGFNLPSPPIWLEAYRGCYRLAPHRL